MFSRQTLSFILTGALLLTQMLASVHQIDHGLLHSEVDCSVCQIAENLGHGVITDDSIVISVAPVIAIPTSIPVSIVDIFASYTQIRAPPRICSIS